MYSSINIIVPTRSLPGPQCISVQLEDLAMNSALVQRVFGLVIHDTAL
jgi:hypothetical protein